MLVTRRLQMLTASFLTGKICALIYEIGFCKHLIIANKFYSTLEKILTDNIYFLVCKNGLGIEFRYSS